jgi:hypothetical protein
MTAHALTAERPLDKRVQVFLEPDGLHLDRSHLGNLISEIHTERIRRVDRLT